MHCLSVVI